MDDATTTCTQLRDFVVNFTKTRDWERYHDPKNLAMALSIEIAELAEHFQWLTPEESNCYAHDATHRKEIAHEIADIMSYILLLCNTLHIDLASTLKEKMLLNAQKYPIPGDNA